MIAQKESSWFALANDLEAMFRDWTRQDDEYGCAMMQLEPGDRDRASEERERAKINATREKLIRQRIMAIPEIAELVKALEECVESLSRLDDKDGAYRVTCLTQAKQLLTRANKINL